MGGSFHLADLFCGAGGTSAGAIEAIRSLGYQPELTAVNHWDIAVATHEANHPEARHLCASLDSLNPRDLFSPGELKLLWASPECTHHSVARGGKPINDQSRATAWCVTRWAEALQPAVILVENVPEFLTWGPTGTNGRPLQRRKGDTFRAWVASLESMGYRVDHRILCAADYGDPTSRKRLFVQAVRGRRRIVWPEPTHSRDGESLFGLQRWRAARECIDWEIPGQSIFARKRPLKPKTMKRIMAGLERFGGKPFLAVLRGTGNVRGIDDPAPTVTSGGGHLGLCEPFVVNVAHAGGNRVTSIDEPIPTIPAGHRGEFGLVQPFLLGQQSGSVPRSVDDPVPTVATSGAIALVEPFILPMEHSGRGRMRPVSEPFPTITTAKGGAIGLVEPFIVEVAHGDDPNKPPRTDRIHGLDEPLGTVPCSNRFGLVEPFITKYYGSGEGASPVSEPVPTVTTKDRFALVIPDGRTMDIRFRMLQPHELAAAQGFRRDYLFTGNKTEQVRQIGNAVPRRLARALVLAAVSQQADISNLVGED